MNHEPFTSIENPTLAHFRHFSSLFTLSPLYICRESSTNQLLFMQNKPNFQRSQMNVNTYNTTDYENIANWTLGESKPNTNPIQTQSNPICQSVKLMQSVYLQRIMKKNADNGYKKTKPKQTQFKPNQTQFPSRNSKNAPDFTKNMVIEKNTSGQQATVLIYPDSLLLEPFFQIAQFTVENLVVVVLFQLMDIAFQFRLLLHNFT